MPSALAAECPKGGAIRSDIIVDFTEDDQILLDAGNYARLDDALASAVQDGADVRLVFEGGEIVLQGLNLATLDRGDFTLT